MDIVQNNLFLQKLNSLKSAMLQLWHHNEVKFVPGCYRYFRWQYKKTLKDFPVKLRISNSRLLAQKPDAITGMVSLLGKYDYNNMNLISKILSENKGVFVDVGANIGTYTLVASEIHGVTVISIEPHPQTYKYLLTNIKLNSRSNIIALNIAISDSNIKLMLTDGAEPAKNRIISPNESQDKGVSVPSKTLDCICHELNVTPLVVKIDVEGYEEKVLNGFQKMDTVGLLLIEGGEREEISKILHPKKFTGPYYCDFKNKILSSNRPKQKEWEFVSDSIYICNTFLPRIREIGFQIT